MSVTHGKKNIAGKNGDTAHLTRVRVGDRVRGGTWMALGVGFGLGVGLGSGLGLG